MTYKRILTIQDISCVGQASLGVALPILSAAGHETAVLPTAVLSTHSVGFTDFTFRDLTFDLPAISRHWQKEGISFDAFYTGYLGSPEQAAMVRDIIDDCGRKDDSGKPVAMFFMDPAMADSGELYPGFDGTMVTAMKELAERADVLLPNLTEASLLTGLPYKEKSNGGYTEEDIHEVLEALDPNGEKTIVLTGVGFAPDETGAAVRENGCIDYVTHKKVDRVCHGTGDVFASAFIGACLNGKSALESARIAADFVYRAILDTVDDEEHWYGVKFEIGLPEYAAAARR